MLRIVRLEFKSNEIPAFIKLFNKHQSDLLSVAGCQSVTLVRDGKAPHKFLTISEWESEAYLEDYRKSPLFKNIWQQVKPMFAAKASVESLDVLSSSVFKSCST